MTISEQREKCLRNHSENGPFPNPLQSLTIGA